jgi:hypothetical protein
VDSLGLLQRYFIDMIVMTEKTSNKAAMVVYKLTFIPLLAPSSPATRVPIFPPPIIATHTDSPHLKISTSLNSYISLNVRLSLQNVYLLL